jgi:hypothetical protein
VANSPAKQKLKEAKSNPLTKAKKKEGKRDKQ